MMGVASNRNAGKTRSNAIDRHIKQESRTCRRANVLLLGSDPERLSVVKQMKVQHGLTDSELTHYRLKVYQNCLDNAQALVRAIRDMGIEYVNHANNVNADRILKYYTPSFVFFPEVAQAIHHIWQDPVIPKVLDFRDELGLGKHADYFFQEILRIGSPCYVPTNTDILRTRENITQLVETYFTFNEFQTVIIDCGVRHSPRRWIHYFEDITCVLFCVSLNDYDQVLQEDDRHSELSESIALFDSIVNCHRFARSSIIVLLTGIDAFRDNLPKIPLEKYFPDYAGGTDVDEALGYIVSRFAQVNRAKVPVYFILHRANDPTTSQHLLAIAKKTILQNTWQEFQRKPSFSAAMRIWSMRSALSPAWSLSRRLRLGYS